MPNAYAVPKALNDITLSDIESLFPLEGEFHFRFKYKFSGTSVWLDLNNKQVKVPKCDSKIIMKVTRKVPKGSGEPREERRNGDGAHSDLLNL
mmetsp:Transcript_8421/g.6282  ORF Transcript_8421/g.6282 Transcript_8421/m.6282 type:complete len:93 (+) Transcript_8421:72-350(+)